jgi:hypothetical protein
MKVVWRAAIAALVLAIAGLSSFETRGNDRLQLFPRVSTGQTLTYWIRSRTDKGVKAQSSVASPMAPNGTQLDAHGLLHIRIIDVQPDGSRSIIHAQSQFQPVDSVPRTAAKQSAAKTSLNLNISNPNGRPVEFTILGDGQLKDAKGLDSLPADQQQIWQEWVTQFAIAAAFPSDGVKTGEKWRYELPERAPSPIAGLSWVSDGTYAGNEPCRALRLLSNGDITESDSAPESCAVIITTAQLRQTSSVKDATPEDFKRRELRTRGSARGTNKIVTYISLKTGLLVRATEEDSQALDATIEKTDRSNGVRYDVSAKSSSEVLLVTEKPTPGVQ